MYANTALELEMKTEYHLHSFFKEGNCVNNPLMTKHKY